MSQDKEENAAAEDINFFGATGDACSDDYVTIEEENFWGEDEPSLFGYQGPIYEGEEERDSAYNYDRAFNNKSTSWYGRTAFNYSKVADYSPSSMFRRSFYRPLYGSTGADNEARNKAVRALRSLTRNANTIVEKSQHEYSVYFSDGTKVNGIGDDISEDKKHIIYVSPDDLLATETIEAEDCVVDALTGFVLLRVQIEQDTSAELRAMMCDSSMRATIAKIVNDVVLGAYKGLEGSGKEKDIHDIVSTQVNNYLAGVLCRTMMMRRGRKNVVKNWGGFAPYFIRHAKKFSEMHDELEKHDNALDMVINAIAYNTLVDENKIELGAEIDAIVSSHFTEEVNTENVFNNSLEVVKQVAALSTTNPAKLTELICEAIAAVTKDVAAKENNDKAELDMLKDAGAALYAVEYAETASNEQLADLELALNDVDLTAKAIASLESAAQAVGQQAHALQENATSTIKQTYDAMSAACGAINSRRVMQETLAKEPDAPVGKTIAENVEKLAALQSQMHEDARKNPNADAAAYAEKAGELLKQFAAELKEHAKKLLPEAKAAANEVIGAFAEALGARSDTHAELFAPTENAAQKIETAEEYASCPNHEAITKLIKELAAAVNRAIPETKELRDRYAARAQEICKDIEKTRSGNGVDKQIRAALRNMVQHKQTAWELSAGSRACAAVASDYNPGSTVSPLSSLISQGAVQDRQSQSNLPENMPAEERAETVAADAQKSIQESAVQAQRQAQSYRAGKQDPDRVNTIASMLLEALEQMAGTSNLSEEEKHEYARKELENTAEDCRWMQLKLDNDNKYAGTIGHGRAVSAGHNLSEKLEKCLDETPIDRELFGDTVRTTTKVLDAAELNTSNKEAENTQEEDYICYINRGNSATATPAVKDSKENQRSSYAEDAATIVKRIRKRYKQFILRIRDALNFQANKRTIEEYGMRSGDLDEGGLYKLGHDAEHIWAQKTTARLPDVAVAILIDQSGSMSGRNIERARDTGIILADALRQIAGVRFYVYGHTANQNGAADLSFFTHYTPTDGDNLTRMGAIRAHSNNYDGYAVKEAAKRLSVDPAKRKYLFVIADGLPAGYGYHGSEATKHVQSVCRYVRDRLKINLYAFGVGLDRSGEEDMFNKQYGAKNTIFVNELTRCLPKIVTFLQNTLRKEKRTVAID